MLERPWTDEGTLVQALARRDAPAVAEVFDRYGGPVRRVLIRTLGSVTDIDDLVQETFLTVLDRITTVRDPSALESFVIGVAIRRARNELRKRALRRWVGLDDDLDEAAAPPDPVLQQGVRHAYRALGRLDATSRVLFVLRHVEELELTELSVALEVSLATVKRKLARAERRFAALAQGDPVLRDYLDGRSG
jgi:RNA polymerase sigma-70 factor (ECF subfamily)